MYVAEWSLTAGLISITPESSIFSESGCHPVETETSRVTSGVGGGVTWG